MMEVIPASQSNVATLESVAEQAKDYAKNARSLNTIRAYTNDWKHFEAWCRDNGFQSLPAVPMTVILYVTAMSETHSVPTIERRLVAISQAHKITEHEPPTRSVQVREVMTGLKRLKQHRPVKKTALLMNDIRKMLDHVSDNLIGVRDRAIILLGFAGALRRSEIVALDVDDIQFTDDGLIVHIRRSKTDQIGEGAKVGIPYGSSRNTCPVRSLQAWLDRSEIVSGALFRSINRHGRMSEKRLSDRAIALLIKKHAAAAGLNSSNYSGHSLRSGMATQADCNGVRFSAIKAQGRWSCDSIVRGYMQRTGLFDDNAAAGLGL